MAGSGLRWRRAHVATAVARAGLPAHAVDTFYARLGAHALAFAAGSAMPVVVGPLLRHAIDTTQGRAKVVWASHTGNWEAALAGMAVHLPLVAIVKRQSQRWADDLATRRRAQAGVALLPPEGSLRAGAAALARGKTVVALGDQAPTRRRGAVADTFLGADCWSDPSAALLAARARCPLWVVAQHWDRGVTHVELLGGLEPRGPAGVVEATRRATGLLEAFVRVHPADWLWLHRRWKELPR